MNIVEIEYPFPSSISHTDFNDAYKDDEIFNQRDAVHSPLLVHNTLFKLDDVLIHHVKAIRIEFFMTQHIIDRVSWAECLAYLQPWIDNTAHLKVVNMDWIRVYADVAARYYDRYPLSNGISDGRALPVHQELLLKHLMSWLFVKRRQFLIDTVNPKNPY